MAGRTISHMVRVDLEMVAGPELSGAMTISQMAADHFGPIARPFVKWSWTI
jgi:hypothetical protein